MFLQDESLFPGSYRSLSVTLLTLNVRRVTGKGGTPVQVLPPERIRRDSGRVIRLRYRNYAETFLPSDNVSRSTRHLQHKNLKLYVKFRIKGVEERRVSYLEVRPGQGIRNGWRILY